MAMHNGSQPDDVGDGGYSEPTQSPRNVVRLNYLGELVRAKRWAEALTLEQASLQSGVSSATLSRLEGLRGDKGKALHEPDTKTLTAITRWLNIPLNEILAEDQGSPSQLAEARKKSNTVEIIHAYLRADKELKPELADDLASLVRAVYAQFVDQEGIAIEGEATTSTEDEADSSIK